MSAQRRPWAWRKRGGYFVDVRSAHVDVEQRFATTVERVDVPLLKAARRCNGGRLQLVGGG